MERKSTISTTGYLIDQVTDNQKHPKQELLAREEPLEIRLSSSSKPVGSTIQYLITMRTPGADEDLAIGLLFSEGIIEKRKDIVQIKRLDPNAIELVLAKEVYFDFNKYRQRELVTASCGICGKSSLEAVSFHSRRLAWSAKVSVPHEVIITLPERLRSSQIQFAQTGGVHAAGLFDLRGNLITLKEDIGRHNALDKLAGSVLDRDLSSALVLVSGRTSFELVQKTAMLGIPILLSIGPASSMAVEVASIEGITLVGFLKGGKYNIYTGSERILL